MKCKTVLHIIWHKDNNNEGHSVIFKQLKTLKWKKENANLTARVVDFCASVLTFMHGSRGGWGGRRGSKIIANVPWNQPPPSGKHNYLLDPSPSPLWKKIRRSAHGIVWCVSQEIQKVMHRLQTKQTSVIIVNSMYTSLFLICENNAYLNSIKIAMSQSNIIPLPQFDVRRQILIRGEIMWYSFYVSVLLITQ